MTKRANYRPLIPGFTDPDSSPASPSDVHLTDGWAKVTGRTVAGVGG
jgi:hypothetical protein